MIDWMPCDRVRSGDQTGEVVIVTRAGWVHVQWDDGQRRVYSPEEAERWLRVDKVSKES